MIEKVFFLAGRATFTLSIPEKFQAEHGCAERYTYKIVRKEKTEKWPVSWFVNILAGPDNTSDFQPLGKLNPETGAVRLVRVTKLTEDSWAVKLVRRVLARVWLDEIEFIEDKGFKLRHAGRCGRCGRKLTVPESIDTGLGAHCADKLGVPWAKAS